MKAWILRTPASVDKHPLLLSDVPMPNLREDELLVRVSAGGIFRTHLHVVEVELPTRRSPMIPSHQIVGRVIEKGARVEDVAVRDRVGVAWLNRTLRPLRV